MALLGELGCEDFVRDRIMSGATHQELAAELRHRYLAFLFDDGRDVSCCGVDDNMENPRIEVFRCTRTLMLKKLDITVQRLARIFKVSKYLCS